MIPLSSGSPARHPRSRRPGRRPASTRRARSVAHLEALESRQLLATSIITGSGATPADILPVVNQFRTTLGTLNANTAGSVQQGRREINWDGVPDNFAAPNDLPADFFNVNSPRGAVFSTPGTGFQVSADTTPAVPGTLVEFGNLDPSYTGQFRTFSPERLFTPLGSNVLDVTFFVPGSTTPATVTGFGAVFTDVDSGTSTTIQLFDRNGGSLGVFPVQASPDGGLSFLGVSDGSVADIARVRITSGGGALGAGNLDVSDGGTRDLVAMDDFLYGEPQTVPTLQFGQPTFTVVEGQPVATITVTRTGGLTEPVSATFTTSAGTATPGQDYTDVAQTVSFAPGVASQTVTIPIFDDANFESLPNETVNLALSNPTGSAVLGAQSAAVLQILDNEPRSLSIDDVTVNESAGTATFTVRLNAASAQTVTVTAATADGTATAPADFTAVPPTVLTFAPGTTSQTVTVPIVNDAVSEPSETFTVTLTSPTNALIADASGVGTILDDDAPVVAQGRTITAVEGVPFSGVVATFTDPDGAGPASNYTATIDWGDGTTSPSQPITATGGTFSVPGTHTYADPGTFPITVTIAEQGAGTAIAFGQAIVADAPLSAVGFQSLLATAGTPLEGVPVVTFGDAGGLNPPGTYTATIDWGDGTPPSLGTIDAGGNVRGSHTYDRPGSFTGSVRVVSADGASVLIPFGTTVVAPALTCQALRTTEGVTLTDATVATFGSATTDPHFYDATIDWGDGSPVEQALVTTTGLVQASHTFAESGNYVVRTTLGTHGTPNLASSTCIAQVADVPINLTGGLNPASDTGVSNTDRITNDNTPTFLGSSEPGSTVQLFATPLDRAGATEVLIGTTAADASGAWAITVPTLPDGRYALRLHAIDRNGQTTADRDLTAASPLVIDTVGPKVTDLLFNRFAGRLLVNFADDRTGLDQASLVDNANYSLTRRGTPPASILFTALGVSAPGPVQTVTGTINGGRLLHSGSYRLTIRSGDVGTNGIRDVAGNPLDGEFYGFFPSGNNRPGGDFVTIINTAGHVVFSPLPLNGFASPLNPPGRPGSAFLYQGRTPRNPQVGAQGRFVTLSRRHGHVVAKPVNVVVPRPAPKGPAAVHPKKG